MDQLVSVEQTKRDKQLPSIKDNPVETEANVAPKFVQSLSQVQAHAFVDQAEMLIVIERVEEADAVLLIVGVTLVEP